MSLLSIYCKY